MSDDRSLSESAPRKGAAIKLLGIACIVVGVLDSMLFWRGGFQMDGAYALLIAFGFFLYALGAIRSGAGHERPTRRRRLRGGRSLGQPEPLADHGRQPLEDDRRRHP